MRSTVIATPDAGPPIRTTGGGGMFSSLRHRNYRLLWIGTVVSSSGDWMDIAALYYLVYHLTKDPFYLTAYSLVRAVPILSLTLFGGVLSDRIERRKLLFWTQTLAMILATLLAVLVSGGWITVWEVLVIGFGRGVMMAFNQPARQSLVSELVPVQDLQNAIALSSASFRLTSVLGPSIGAVAIAIAGLQGAFWLNAASFLVLLWCLIAMQFPARVEAIGRAGMLSSLVEGIGYLRRHRQLGPLVLLATMPMVFGQSYLYILPVFASDVLHVGAVGNSFLVASSGVGGLLCALVIAAAHGCRRRGWLMTVGLIVFGGGLVAFALAKLFWLSLFFLFIAGIGSMAYQTTNSTLVQEIVDPPYRGRVLSTLSLNIGFVPLGTALASTMITLFGAPASEAIMGGSLVLVGLWVALWVSRIRALP
ncbi:MAG: MFS transporter [Dehalococcoidia bacterium]